MWYPFKKQVEENRDALKRGEEAQQLLKEMRTKIETEEKIEAEKIFKEKELERLADEEEKRLSAEKDLHTEAGVPYIRIVEIEVDGKQITEGNISFDWNDIFIQKLTEGGYRGESDEILVEQWFRDVCKHIVLETYEQSNSDLGYPARKKDLGEGKSEYS